MHPADKIKVMMQKIELTPAAVDFLKSFRAEVDDALEEGVDNEEIDQLVFRVGILEGIFWIGFEDESEVSDLDEVLFEDKDLKVICQDAAFEILRGTTVDYELHGLSMSLVFKDENGMTYCSGEPHPRLQRI